MACVVAVRSSNSSAKIMPESIVVQPYNNKLAIGKSQQFKLVSSYSGDVSVISGLEFVVFLRCCNIFGRNGVSNGSR